MLYTDAPFITQADLTSIESEIPTVAEAASIDLDAHIQLATDEFSDWLQAQNITFSGYIPPFNTPASPSYALVNLLTQASNRCRMSLSQIVVTDGEYPGKWSVLKRLGVYTAVAKFYRQAASRKEVDRYEKKFESYTNEVARVYKPMFKRRGVPIVNRPMAAPGAYQETNPGTWGDSNLSRLLGTTTVSDDPIVEVVVSWVDGSLYKSRSANLNGEGAASAIASIVMHAGDSVVVDISTLIGPNGQFGPQSLGNMPVTPLTATGWNVYASVDDGPFHQQNASPIDYATKTFTLASTPLSTGNKLTNGQWPDMWIPMPDLIYRG